MIPKEKVGLTKLFAYLTLAVLGGVLLVPVVSYANLTLDSTSLTSDGALNLRGAVSSATNLPNASSTNTALVFGGDANLYRSAPDTLKTDDALVITGNTTLLTPSTNSLIYTGSTSILTALASSTAGKVLTATSTAPYFAWEAAASIPAGTLAMYASSTAPTGWLLADGSAVSRTTYASLFAVIGTAYGIGDGSTTFNLPDLQGRVAVGLNSSNTDVDALGENEGAVIGSRTPKHKHTVVQPTISGNVGIPTINSGVAGGYNSVLGSASVLSGTQYSSGGSPPLSASGGTVGPQSNAPTDTAAYLTVNYIIKY